MLSSVVIWEIAIKRGIGKLAVKSDIEKVLLNSGFEQLSITERHAWATELLPFHHRDPFDRMLIAQAIMEDAVLVTRDLQFARYGVGTIPA